MSQAEHRPDYGQMLASLSVPVLLISPEHFISYANDASEAFFGRSRRRLEGQRIDDILMFESERMNAALLSSESDISAQDMELKTPDGIITVDVNLSSVSKDPEWRIAVISPRNGGREHIGDQRDSGQQQAMGAPAVLGHEIKNPLAGMRLTALRGCWTKCKSWGALNQRSLRRPIFIC
jgi:two-component system nitrogen regulation sensor histidine kinase GlnL